MQWKITHQPYLCIETTDNFNNSYCHLVMIPKTGRQVTRDLQSVPADNFRTKSIRMTNGRDINQTAFMTLKEIDTCLHLTCVVLGRKRLTDEEIEELKEEVDNEMEDQSYEGK